MALLRKPRSDSKLEALTEAQKADLESWLLGNMSYENAVALAKKEFGVQTSVAALHGFWQSFVAPRRIARRQRAAQMSDQMVEEIAKNPAQWDDTLKDGLKEAVCNLLASPKPDTEAIFFLMQCVAKTNDQEIKKQQIELSDRRLKLLEAKMREANSKLQELRDPSKADDSKSRQAILDEVDRIMGVKKK